MTEAPPRLRDPLDPPLGTTSLPGTGGRIGPRLEDFQVIEIPAYEPAGHGTHCFLRVRKRGLTSPQAATRLARALGRHPGEVGIAGLKDRRAVTEQWLSIPDVDPAHARDVCVPDIDVLEARCHPHKLRTGHLRGNRFAVRLLDPKPGAGPCATTVLEALASQGLLNLYGPQRFGRHAENLSQGLALLQGQRRHRGHRRERRLLVSAVQAALFNDYAARRLQVGPLHTPLVGEIYQRGERGRPGRCEAADLARITAGLGAGELRLTGPLFGPKMRPPSAGEPAALEAQSLDAAGLNRETFEQWRRVAPGGRRPLTVIPQQVEVDESAPDELWLRFTLPAGAYATVLLREVTKTPFSALRPGRDVQP